MQAVLGTTVPWGQACDASALHSRRAQRSPHEAGYCALQDLGACVLRHGQSWPAWAARARGAELVILVPAVGHLGLGLTPLNEPRVASGQL